ncbi:MAG: hypothetical protein WBA09_22440 [Candidatus Acidiferrum sp.]
MPTLKLSRKGHLYAAFRSTPNPNDHGFPAHLVQRVGAFPVRGALTGGIRAPQDQAQTGMCTGEGSTGLGVRLYMRWKGLTPDFAPEFTYALERMKEGTFPQDAGAQVATSLQVPDPAQNDPHCVGWCPRNVPGYKPLDITTPPSDAQLAEAKNWPGGAYHTIGNNIANIKSCILSDYSGVIGISVYESFESDEADASGLTPYPNINVEELLGGHEEHSLLAFDDTVQCPNAPNPGAVLTENSWGQEWGCAPPEWAKNLGTTKGFNWIPYDYLMDPNLTSDVKMGHLGKPW